MFLKHFPRKTDSNHIHRIQFKPYSFKSNQFIPIQSNNRLKHEALKFSCCEFLEGKPSRIRPRKIK